MKPRHKRFALIGGGLAVLGIAAALVLNAFQSNLVFFFTPTQIAAGEAPKGKAFRIGGLVKDGSLKRQPDGLTVQFIVTDTAKEITVAYTGILPDLFREGKGVVAQGKLGENSLLVKNTLDAVDWPRFEPRFLSPFEMAAKIRASFIR
jgi:cytochrome c-type biogenesis protein CcmE